jgi:uncharacterized protein (DUF433 family)
MMSKTVAGDRDQIGTSRIAGQDDRRRRDMDYRQIITIDPKKRSGKPCIRGMRMTVYDVLEYLASGMTHAEILDDFPDLTEDDIRACLAFAADMGKRVAVLPSLPPSPPAP